MSILVFLSSYLYKNAKKRLLQTDPVYGNTHPESMRAQVLV